MIQLFLIWRLAQAYLSPKDSFSEPNPWPQVLAILCLRGTDPFLPECLRRLANMKYANFTLRIVIDSENDPACETVKAFLHAESPSHVEVTYLRNRRPHCSGKFSGILAATEKLPEGCEIVAFFDGDTMVFPDCLKELVAPLQDERIGVTSGNRWYAPQSQNFASLVRFTWNALAVPFMNVAQMPWGGCMALRAREMSNPAVREYCEQRFNEDMTLGSYVIQQGQRVFFVTNATIVNHETITMKSFYNFLVRQLLAVRSSFFGWRLLFVNILALNLSVLALYCLAFPIPCKAEVASSLLGIALLLYLGMLGSDFMIREKIAHRGETIPRWPITTLFVLPVAMVCVNSLNLVASIQALWGGIHVWRGITYRFSYRRPIPYSTVVDVQSLATNDSVLGEFARNDPALMLDMQKACQTGTMMPASAMDPIPLPIDFGKTEETFRRNGF